jgi:hypothetical protein
MTDEEKFYFSDNFKKIFKEASEAVDEEVEDDTPSVIVKLLDENAEGAIVVYSGTLKECWIYGEEHNEIMPAIITTRAIFDYTGIEVKLQ